MNNVTLQINLAPVDYLHAVHILPHQLDALADQVDEVLLTLDTRKGKGRFAEGWLKHEERLLDFLYQEIVPKYKVSILPVRYDNRAKQEVAKCFFEKSVLPERDFRGGPFYVYFYGLYHAKNQYVFHLDSDILLGGGCTSWISEAVAMLENNKKCLIISPLPGPPHPADMLIGQPGATRIAANTFVFNNMSTRIFLLNKSVFKHNKLVLKKPSIKNQLKALIEGNPAADLPEHLFSDYMRINSLKRIDFLGSSKGLWSLHPPYRSAYFYQNLPLLINRIEFNDIPKSQLGFYDVTDDLCDWTDARSKVGQNRWYKRLFKIDNKRS